MLNFKIVSHSKRGTFFFRKVMLNFHLSIQRVGSKGLKY